MEIQEGKFYRTRDGRKVGPMRRDNLSGNPEYEFRAPENPGSVYPAAWFADGKMFHRKDHPDDLIAEWQDEPETGTLQELNVKPGDVVEFLDNDNWYPEAVGHKFEVDSKLRVHSKSWGDGFSEYCNHKFRIISRAGASEEDTPRTWGEMTDAEKGALLLAEYQGKTVEVYIVDHDWKGWCEKRIDFTENLSYRIRPEPKRETVRGRLHILDGSWPQSIPVSLVVEDGTPDCASIEMEEL